VLAKVNSVLAAHDVNVEGQALKTRDHLGYLLTDVGTDYAPDVVQALERMPETMRLRVLS
jgi:D-3-phosphoglycerate dehydrogenase